MMQAKPQFKTAPDSTPDISSMTIGNKIAWKQSGLHKGRGVFALVDFAEGDVVEQSPVTIVPKAETDMFDQGMNGDDSIIDQYLLRWRPEIKGQEYCLGHGFLMLYNHSGKANGILTYQFDFKTISMVAARDIRAGEEITFDYDCEIWFPVKD